jgi:hypothetical protein
VRRILITLVRSYRYSGSSNSIGSSARLISPSIEGGKSQGRGDGNTCRGQRFFCRYPFKLCSPRCSLKALSSPQMQDGGVPFLGGASESPTLPAKCTPSLQMWGVLFCSSHGCCPCCKCEMFSFIAHGPTLSPNTRKWGSLFFLLMSTVLQPLHSLQMQWMASFTPPYAMPSPK